MEENKNINLMPEDLRQIEDQIKAKQHASFTADLIEPAKDKFPKHHDIQAAKPKFSFASIWSKLFKRRPKAPKIDKPSAPVILTAKVSEPIMLVPDKPSTPPQATAAQAPITPADRVFERVVPAPPAPPVAPSQQPIQANPDNKYHQPLQGNKSRFADEGGVNLIPESLELKSWHEIFNYLLVSIILAGVVTGVIYAVLLVQESNLIKQTNLAASQISDLEKEILNFEKTNNQITDFGQQIRLANDILNKHVYWTEFFRLLEKYTWRDVYYSGFSAGDNGAFTLDATGPDMDAVASQLKVLESEAAQEFVKSASITSAAKSPDGVTFSINFILNDQLFYYD